MCVAGMCTATWTHVRPVFPSGTPLGVELHTARGGLFSLGAVVELGEVQPRGGAAPQVEDYVFAPAATQSTRHMEPEEFWDTLAKVAVGSMRTVFGNDFIKVGATAAVVEGGGKASLGCLRPRVFSALWVDDFDHVRASLSDGAMECERASVTDLRLHRADGKPDEQSVQLLWERVSGGAECLLSIGLSGAFRKRGDTCERCYLQVNNIHLADDPLWCPP